MRHHAIVSLRRQSLEGRTVVFSRHERIDHYRPKTFLSARLQHLVLAVFGRAMTRPSDQVHTKMIPDVNRQRSICPRTSEHGLIGQEDKA